MKLFFQSHGMKILMSLLILMPFTIFSDEQHSSKQESVQSTESNKAKHNKRARDWGIPFDGIPGQHNAITDVPGVEVGYYTLIQGDGSLVVGKGPIRTGVTVIMPSGRHKRYLPAAVFSLNGDGELTGSHYINDYGFLGTMIGITNTNSIGIVRDAIGEWNYKNYSSGGLEDFSFSLPVVGETWDGDFNDINGYHVKKEHVFSAIENARSGPVLEGNVGGGTGMWLYGFKGGSGTASRKITVADKNYTVGVFVQANFGQREELVIAGVPVGRMITDLQPVFQDGRKDGSIIAIVATDAPMLPLYLRLVARRVSLGMARTGTISGNGSGDIFLAFSTHRTTRNGQLMQLGFIPKWQLDPIFKATVEATEEAIINALVAAETMTGANGNIMYGLPEKRVAELLRLHHRIQ
ncbi:P1 family peptidase [Marinicella sp. W31]|uniref:DmpA family aminopeptidase n=1 Tax=Marinicella sp. W31 TaxID=3023713 RepID=UPI00375729A6